MQISIKYIFNKTTLLHVKETDTVHQIKQQIELKDNIPMNQQRIIYKETCLIMKYLKILA